MRNVNAIRWHTLNNFEHVQKYFAYLRKKTYTDVCQRIWNVHDACLTYPKRTSAYDSVSSLRSHTLMSYDDVIRFRVTALYYNITLYCIEVKMTY